KRAQFDAQKSSARLIAAHSPSLCAGNRDGCIAARSTVRKYSENWLILTYARQNGPPLLDAMVACSSIQVRPSQKQGRSDGLNLGGLPWPFQRPRFALTSFRSRLAIATHLA